LILVYRETFLNKYCNIDAKTNQNEFNTGTHMN